jgi:hypothetical protein
MCLENCNDNSSLITPSNTSRNIGHPSTHPARSNLQAMQSTGPAQDCSSAWDLNNLDSEPQPSQPRGKKRKVNGGAAAHIDFEDSSEHTEPIDSEQLHTPHGQRTSNISFTRTNTVQKIFAPAMNRAIPAMSGTLPPSSPTRAARHNQSSAQQPNTQRQQTQRTTSRAGPNHTNLNAHNGSGNGYRVASGNANHAQNNNGRGQRRGRVVMALAAIGAKMSIPTTAGISGLGRASEVEILG